MAIGSPDKAARREQLRSFASVLVRSGYFDAARVRAELLEAVRDEIRPAVEAAAHTDLLIDQAWADLAAEAAVWPVPTAYDRFQRALADLRQSDVMVLEAVDDHWSADAELRRCAAEGRRPRGIAYFTPADVWHAVEHQMLELNVWHGSAANVRAGDVLIRSVQQVFAEHGIDTRFDEGRLEVSLSWQRYLERAEDSHSQ